ncbi:TIGR03773 family transporter-associated surface protein [Actinomyces sp. HMSC035G02]|uniref:TIGR03773 family transporter-associated surface protein n=1 Tax=Actinomyces sp. HMSC035G02 TaxID=1739406 RepID=UPI0008A875DC|nr:TIGR03773 family transporter-associated surface protein [Actinomyces sp. HMSC035G02]OHR18960.1 cobalt ABC transporter permease [Actinomyces sp. HMSC035G02]
MNPTKYRNPGRAAARAFAAMALAVTSFLVPGAAHAADEATADTADAVATEEATEATADAATASSEADATTCAVMRTAPAGTTATLDHGHADIFDLSSDASGALTLRIKEDATGSGVMREPEQTLLAVNKSTLTQIPADVSQATGAPSAAYLLGQTGDNQATVLWPGWDTLGVAAGGYDAARFHISYTGPADGRIYAFTSSFTEGMKAVTNDGSFDLAPGGDDIDQPYAAHKHVNWLFTRAGRYTLTVQASAWTPGNTGAANAQSAVHTYTINVADEASCLAESGAAPSTDQAQPAPAPGVGPGSVNSTNNQAAQDQGVGGATGTPSAPAPAPGATGTTGNTGMTTGANPAPSSGVRTTSGTTGGERCVATRITREATEAEAATLASNNAPANTARTTLTVSVGDGASGNATDGHFDLGPAIENGTLVARVKDDRSQPAQWVDPSSLTFALGDAARITAPADLGFVATPGSSVWLIPSTQIAGVPWLGLNSQREEIVTGTTGPVQFTLDAVEGPGRVAVFNAGALGSGVGEHVFDGPGTGYTLGANTHAHQNWVFTAPGTYTLTITMRVTPNGAALAGSGFGSGGDLTATGATGPNGRPMVSQVVGRTASGKDCDLSLATTGADTIPLTVVSLTWALTGAACVWVGAIGRRRNLRATL